jgi:hypothetical protein
MHISIWDKKKEEKGRKRNSRSGNEEAIKVGKKKHQGRNGKERHGWEGRKEGKFIHGEEHKRRIESKRRTEEAKEGKRERGRGERKGTSFSPWSIPIYCRTALKEGSKEGK